MNICHRRGKRSEKHQRYERNPSNPFFLFRTGVFLCCFIRNRGRKRKKCEKTHSNWESSRAVFWVFKIAVNFQTPVYLEYAPGSLRILLSSWGKDTLVTQGANAFLSKWSDRPSASLRISNPYSHPRNPYHPLGDYINPMETRWGLRRQRSIDLPRRSGEFIRWAPVLTDLAGISFELWYGGDIGWR